MDTAEYIEMKVAEAERDIYGGEMPPENKAALRKMLKEEADFWERWDIRKDSNRGADDQ